MGTVDGRGGGMGRGGQRGKNGTTVIERYKNFQNTYFRTKNVKCLRYLYFDYKLKYLFGILE